VEVTTALTDIRKNQIAVLQRLTAIHARVNRKLGDTLSTHSSIEVRHLVDSAVTLATHASHQALLDSATYAGFRVRRLSASDIALLRAAEAFKHAEAEAWREEARAWRARKEGQSVAHDSEYLSVDERFEIAGRGFNAAYEQSTKTRAEDETQWAEVNARLKQELDDASSFYHKVAISGALSSVILIVALSRALSKPPKTDDKTSNGLEKAGGTQVDSGEEASNQEGRPKKIE
jgi:hypothetical protein